MLQKENFLLPFFFVAANLQAQMPCLNAIRGGVYSASGHNPLSFTAVRIQDQHIQVFCDEKGQFEICGLKPGSYKIVFRQLGYDSLVIQAETGGKKLLLHLEEKDRWLHAVDVKGRHRHFESEVVENSALHGQELEQSRGLSLGELIRKIPGVTAIQSGPGVFKPSIQGMSAQRVAIVQNGVKLEGQQWGFDHAPETDPGLADEIVVVRGAQAVRFGSEAMGGTILLDPGDIENTGRPDIRLNSAFFSNGRGFSQGIRLQQKHSGSHTLSWRFSGNGRKSGNFNTARYYLGNTALEEFSSSLLIRHEKGKVWKNEITASYFRSKPGIFSGAHISSPDGIRQAFSRPDSTYRYGFTYNIGRPFQNTGHFLSKVKSCRQWTENQESSLSLSYQRDVREEFDIIRRNGLCPDCPQLYFELQNRQAEFLHHIRSEGKELTVGLVGMYQSNVVERRILIPNFRLWQAAVFASAGLFRGDWAWEAGFRLENRRQQIFRYVQEQLEQPVFHFLYWMGNIGVRREFSHHWHARLNIQYSQRPPSVPELFSNGVHQGSASFEKGDEKLVPETVAGINASLHHESEHFDILWNLFLNYSDNYIYLSPVKDSIVLSIRGPYPFFQYRQTMVSMLGGDLNAIWKMTESWQMHIQGSLIRSHDLSAGTPLIYQQADRMQFNLRWRSRIYGEGKWQIGAETGPLMVARQSRAPETDFVEAPPAYILWGGRLSLNRSSGKLPLEASIEGQNLLNAAYRDYLNRFRYFAYDTGRNLIFRFSISI